jgi:hypothetical protein
VIVVVVHHLPSVHVVHARDTTPRKAYGMYEVRRECESGDQARLVASSMAMGAALAGVQSIASERIGGHYHTLYNSRTAT